MQIVCDFSAADGFRRDAHIDIRREAQRQTRPRRRSKLHVAAHARTDAYKSLGRPSLRRACGSAREDTAAIGPCAGWQRRRGPDGAAVGQWPQRH